jgi:hypothetical protein
MYRNLKPLVTPVKYVYCAADFDVTEDQLKSITCEDWKALVNLHISITQGRIPRTAQDYDEAIDGLKVVLKAKRPDKLLSKYLEKLKLTDLQEHIPAKLTQNIEITVTENHDDTNKTFDTKFIDKPIENLIKTPPPLDAEKMPAKSALTGEAFKSSVLKGQVRFKMLPKKNSMPNDTFNFTVLSVSPIFQVISKAERKSLTEIKDGVVIDKMRDAPDVLKTREGTYALTGTHLCMNDARVLCAAYLVAAQNYSVKDKPYVWGLDVRLIARALGITSKKIYPVTFEMINRSLNRIGNCDIKFEPSDEYKWLKPFDGKILDTESGLRQKELYMRFNLAILDSWVGGRFSHTNMAFINGLDQWEFRLVMYLDSHKYGFHEALRIKQWDLMQNLTGKVWSMETERKFVTKIKRTMKSLKDKGYLAQESHHNDVSFHFYKMPPANHNKTVLRVIK